MAGRAKKHLYAQAAGHSMKKLVHAKHPDFRQSFPGHKAGPYHVGRHVAKPEHSHSGIRPALKLGEKNASISPHGRVVHAHATLGF